ncbi:LysR family transcriptional regulator [Grimontia sp. NTOU-MAR1]|uniref:LysR family transcriptional regulator n=1 Tax=Grimontia sp. NTOU-MAR1 TaxID=3111011 RepID=UPI002DB6CDD7|nr:LysR family transcriptional regulator [Grimontia sp. NTOU-MAR1]WRW01005.1 LysR family transcriptional regulator [Grimontia sp. NTOU-MAR1]
METKHITYQMQLYAALVRAGSFTQAAEQLGITRSWLSQQISGLEKSLNTLLLHRTTRTLRMTESGERLYEHAVVMESLLEKVQEDMTFAQDSLQGTLKISSPSALAQVLVLPVIQTLRKRHPELHIELSVNDSVEDLLRENIDVAIRVGPMPDSSLKARYLGTFHQYWYQAVEMKERDDQIITLPWHHDKGPADLKVNNIHTATEMAKQGLGRVLLPDIFALPLCLQGELEKLPISVPDSIQSRDVHAVHPYSSFTPNRITVFIKAIHQQFDNQRALANTHDGF